ncbi:MAG: aminotransferase class V-fold PLP-dependent enzyme [Bacteroidetes bacterium]|nr:aminotransferase class V-fold PLP-dependent enzyme [Bacteroidota bacterium]
MNATLWASPPPIDTLETHFAPFRAGVVGVDATVETPKGTMPLVYADWIASGRLYGPIEARMAETFAPFVGNTHTETSACGTLMTRAYHEAQRRIKAHVGACTDDVLIVAGSGMTGVVNKFQRILGLRLPERLQRFADVPEAERPVVFVTHMEHHSNQTSWLETTADVVVVEAGDDGLVDVERLEETVGRYAASGRLLIGAFSACSNVTGIETPIHAMAAVMHRHGGLCFADYAASAPYVDIDMHPDGPGADTSLDAIYFSPHKFLGGPGTPGVLVFHKRLYQNTVPDHPGGGTVNWTNPWGGHSYVTDIEAREDGGTPAFLQTIRAALAVDVKEQMGTAAIRAREAELLAVALPRLRAMPGVHLLADAHDDRLGIVSFYVEDVHFNLLVRLLNDRYGVQVRGGCSCAGTYGHYLLHVDPSRSAAITDAIEAGDLTDKPGWVRLSLHPTMTDAELAYTLDAIEACIVHADAWRADYRYDPHTNEYVFDGPDPLPDVAGWFSV